MTDRSPDADLHFWFDPVCPFAWMTSRWVRLVAAQRAYAVQWRPISLRLLNRHVDYDSRFPPEYEAGHTAGLRLLRVVARTRAEHGPDAVGPLYEALGRADLHGDGADEQRPRPPRPWRAAPGRAGEAGLPAGPGRGARGRPRGTTSCSGRPTQRWR
jgi:hypothetical protein